MGGKLGSESTVATGWWFGSAGIALVLAACGGVSIAARKYLPQASTPLLKVIGRVSLSPKHSVYLLRVDDRVLLIGAGPQGAPSYLGEMSDTTDDAGAPGDFLPATQPLPSIRTVIPAPEDRHRGRFDVRLGDEE